MNLKNLYIIKENLHDKYTVRAVSQIEYAIQVNEVHDDEYSDIINQAITILNEDYDKDALITSKTVQSIELTLMPMSEHIKSLKVYCVAHAHIDMNWMWGFHETVSITLSSLKTMLTLMDEYPDFKFSQSQAAIYEIVEKYDPNMLEDIKKRVHEGRWEITASTWVEGDKNMVDGESLVRQVLYAKKYLSQLFDIDSRLINIGFEPDTFGHSYQLPEIYNQCGIKYYYFCRGSNGPHAFNWQSKSGQQLLAYRDPIWYLGAIHPYDFSYLPQFVKNNHLSNAMKVYGVGNHGGGATRKDLDTIIEMNKWPLMPTFVFGTYRDFFIEMEENRDQLPTHNDEINPIFPGCYTSQVRIKQGNRKSEQLLKYAEKAIVLSGEKSNSKLEDAWHKVLFNQFHDILPGSGITDTREYAMANYQQVYAATGAVITKSLQQISSQIDTKEFIKEQFISDTSVGAGGGFGASIGNFSNVTHNSEVRIFTIFNLENQDITKTQEITIWDYEFDVSNINVQNSKKENVLFEIIDYQKKFYWSHHYQRILVFVKVPANGYITLSVKYDHEKINSFHNPFPNEQAMRVTNDISYVLENEYIKAIFSSQNGSIVYLYDKQNDQEIVKLNQLTGFLRYNIEDATEGMTAWKVGQLINIENLTNQIRIDERQYHKSEIKQTFGYHTKVNNSTIDVLITLEKESRRLNYAVNLDWQEIGSHLIGVPNLDFYLESKQFEKECTYDIPMGIIKRKISDIDQPALNFLYRKVGKSGVMISSKNGHAFKCADQYITHSLIRSSSDPDKYPEVGMHQLEFALSIGKYQENIELYKELCNYQSNLYVISIKPFEGTKKIDDKLLNISSDDLLISAVKSAENQIGIIARFVEVNGKSASVKIEGFSDCKAFETDHLEMIKKEIKNKNDHFEINLEPYQVKTIMLLKNDKNY